MELLHTNPLKNNWELCKFLLSLAVGIMIIVFFGFYYRSAKPLILDFCEYLNLKPPSQLKAWDCWEIGALIWSSFTAFVFYFFTPEIHTSRRELEEIRLQIIAFIIFWLFEHANGHDKDTEIFLSGAISFQFVAATFAFAFIQGGLSRKAVVMVEQLMKKPGLINPL